MTQVTRGSWSFVEKGDIAYLVPVEVAPKTLVLSQLVLYKRVTRDRFAR